MNLFKISIFAVALVVGATAFAQEELGVSIAEDSPAQKANRRSYPGGRDEEDLKVQASLPSPPRDPDMRSVTPVLPDAAHD